MDYHDLNAVTVKDAYPLPYIGECLDTLSGSKWFNFTDLCSRYWQDEMDETDKKKTVSELGLDCTNSRLCHLV